MFAKVYSRILSSSKDLNVHLTHILILKISFLNTIGSIVKEKKKNLVFQTAFSFFSGLMRGIKYLLCAFQERQSENCMSRPGPTSPGLMFL